MKTKPWQKVIMRTITLCAFLNRRMGMTGYLASFHSLSIASTQVKTPKMMRQITVADAQG